MLRRWLLPITLVSGCVAAPPDPQTSAAVDPVTPAPVIAAERAFAADGAQRGWTAAFRTWAAPEAVMLSPGPVNAQEKLATIPGDGETTLDWRPAYAGIARSGELGFTTGPFQIRGRDGVVGHYFTVWRRQPDGRWKWIFDAGTDVIDTDPIAADAQVPVLPVAGRGAGTAQDAIDQVTALEAGQADAAALAGLLAEDARVHRPFLPRAIGKPSAAALFTADGAARFSSLRREASSAGDLVFSMGEVHDRHEGTERLRYYARIWQLRTEGWRIVFDEIVPRRG
jgi:ketosteroid isomerase-like protein